ncbi:hypothetical protein DSC45_31225 [Streptomyces sp. YIM 130001]|uniref:hypothetical protein n=1 Tax=Streptomyces sp. YIM 130001 TaxID=2259644 RepID=UPI000EE8F379|nr:hypothetical protein [Streptomyces sp. YIM 130001]RII09349.1 hypothetical protein DSC45_31225 [Streptomyces sp. YIM 130001]
MVDRAKGAGVSGGGVSGGSVHQRDGAGPARPARLAPSARLLCAALLAVLGVLLPGQTYPGAPLTGIASETTGAPATAQGDRVPTSFGLDSSVTSTDHCVTPRAHRGVPVEQPLAHPGAVTSAGILLPRPPTAGQPMPRAPDATAERPLVTACSGRAPPLPTGI